MSKKFTITLDISGLPCPAPLLGAKKILDDLQADQILCLISDCSGAHDDLSAWCRITGHQLLSASVQDDGKTIYLLSRSDGVKTTPIPHAMLDMRGIACPGPIIQAKKLLEGMQSGEVLQLITDCTAAIDEVPSWAHEVAIEMLLALEVGKGVQEFYLKKR
jgi:TusA-related sulfurtransferase